MSKQARQPMQDREAAVLRTVGRNPRCDVNHIAIATGLGKGYATHICQKLVSESRLTIKECPQSGQHLYSLPPTQGARRIANAAWV
ncbi:hypothetical protein [Spongiibacter tropicus]|uniref:hypothetical protein n=1 Tax=Spongiibacter tropicus TaxID=454602 RepID=UPI0003B3F1A8|nr:hypothetical protein [Spongiibacter tropicus]